MEPERRGKAAGEKRLRKHCEEISSVHIRDRIPEATPPKTIVDTTIIVTLLFRDTSRGYLAVEISSRATIYREQVRVLSLARIIFG